MKVLVTGASGFIGQHLVQYLINHNFDVVATTRKKGVLFSSKVIQTNISIDTDWLKALNNVKYVIHLAARAHILKDTTNDPLSEFRNINTEGTLNLARQAASAGVRRFIFLSSIGVNGNQTTTPPFTYKNTPAPVEPYAISKLEAEISLKKICEETGMQYVIIRPPLVYGPNAPGNFSQLIKIIAKATPLPLGAIKNQRSFVAIDNLIDLIKTCIEHPVAANQTFLVSDDEDISTTELLLRMAKALEKKARLAPVPASFLILGASLLGKRDMAQRLCGSLQVDITHTKKTLGWHPPVSMNEALKKTADAYLLKLANEQNK